MAQEIDDTELCGIISARLRDRQDKASKIDMLEYELERTKDALKTCMELLAELRKKSFWQNNTEFVQLIDKGVPNVGIQS